MRLIIKGLLIVIAVVFLFMVIGKRSTNETVATIRFPDGFVVEADVADTLERQYQGLSGRESLAPNAGMLFVYDDLVAPGYVMRDMLIPIDILWISGDRLIGFDESLQPEDPVVTVYRPSEPVDRVLEVPAGFAQAHRLAVGDTLDIRLPER